MEDSRMEQQLNALYSSLHEMVGLHRQLLDLVRVERDALIAADKKLIQETAFSKEALIYSIQIMEKRRRELLESVAIHLRVPTTELTLSQLAMLIQGDDLKRADQFRSILNTLQILVARVQEQNKENSGLVEKTLEHLKKMRENALGVSAEHVDRYSQQGTRIQNHSSSRLLSQEV
jgi:hypothetical protein